MSPVTVWSLVALVVTAALFRAVDARGRKRWRDAGSAARFVGGPYRTAIVGNAQHSSPPRSVRAAALSSVLLAFASVPVVVAVLDTPHFDGIAVPLVPGLALQIASAWCAARLLARASDDATHAARLAGRTSLFFHGSLSLLALAHLVVVETEWGSHVHACSRSLALGVLGLALAATVQGLGLVYAAAARAAITSPSTLESGFLRR